MSNPEFPVAAPEPVKLPKDMMFPIRASGPIVFDVKTIDGEEFKLMIGGVGPVSGASNVGGQTVCMRHLKLILRMMLGRRFDSPEIPICYTDLLRCDGTKSRMLLQKTITELSNVWVHKITGNVTKTARLIEFNADVYYKEGVRRDDIDAISKEENIQYRRLRNVRFHEDFWRACLNWENCHNVRADVVLDIRSELVAAAYLALTPKAYHPKINENNKGCKDAASLLREIGANVPNCTYELKRLFERPYDGLSVLQQLNGLPTWRGILMVDEKLEPNANKTGFNVRYWIAKNLNEALGDSEEAKTRLQNQGVLYKIWTDKGLAPEDYDKCQKPHCRRIESYEEEILTTLGYPVEKNRRYLELVRSFVGHVEFGCMLGAVKAEKHKGEIRDMEKFVGATLRNAFTDYAETLSKKKKA